eukprot:g3635.t1
MQPPTWRSDLLSKLDAHKNCLLEQIHNAENFIDTVEQLAEFNGDEITTELGLKSDVSISTVLKNPKEVFVNIGLGIYITCNSKEALELVSTKRAYLQEELEKVLVQVGKAQVDEECVASILALNKGN